MAREFIVPGQMITGSGALDMAQNTLGTLGKKAMIVTDKVMIDLGNCAKVENALKSQNVEYTIYSEIAGEPTDTMIAKGLEQYKAEGCDFLVALGGGSPIDSMKAIGSLVKNGGNISDYISSAASLIKYRSRIFSVAHIILTGCSFTIRALRSGTENSAALLRIFRIFFCIKQKGAGTHAWIIYR